jgi:hypothetical protein
MDKSTILKAFNTHFFEFVTDVINIFPEQPELVTTRKTFEMIRHANPTAILKVWHSQVYSPYKDPIEQGNLDFFFTKNYEKDVGTLSNGREIMRVIDTLRSPIQSMSPTNKEHTMQYIQNLSTLSTAWTTA